MSRRTFGAAFAAGGTNLDLLRLLGALLVLMSHAWILTGHAEDEPFARAMARYTDGGGLAVAMFFVVSGFLIARSAQVHPVGTYVRARAARIYPAFAVAVLVQTFAIGLLASRLPWGTYLTAPGTWDAVWRALLFSPRLGLPGVFEGNPLPLAVNGSLWTLRFEALCYAGVLALAAVGLLRRGWVLLPVLGGFALLAVVHLRLPDPRLIAVVDCVVHFLMGAAFWCYRDETPRRWWLALLGLVALALAAGRPGAQGVFHLVLPYLVLYAGLSAAVAAGLLRRLGDVSYGTYLYAFPIQQAVVALWGAGLDPWGLIALAVPPTVLCGVLSRRLIEQPALRWARRAS